MNFKQRKLIRRKRLYRKTNQVQYGSRSQQLVQRAIEEPNLLTSDHVMELQRTLGNQFVLNMMSQKTTPQAKTPIQRFANVTIQRKVDLSKMSKGRGVLQRAGLNPHLRNRAYARAQANKMIALYKKYCFHNALWDIYDDASEFDGTFETAAEQQRAIADNFVEQGMHYVEKLSKYMGGIDANKAKKLNWVGFESSKKDQKKSKEASLGLSAARDGRLVSTPQPMRDKMIKKAKKKEKHLIARIQERNEST